MTGAPIPIGTPTASPGDPAPAGITTGAPAPAPADTAQARLAAMYPSMANRDAATSINGAPLTANPAQAAPAPKAPGSPPGARQAPAGAPGTQVTPAAGSPPGAPQAPAAAPSKAPTSSTPAEIPAAYQGLQVPEGFQLNAEAFAPVAGELAKLGLGKGQVEALLPVYAGMQQREEAAVDRELATWRTETERTLTAEDRTALGAVMADAPDDVMKVLNATGLGSHPALVRWLAGVGRRLAGMPAAPGNALEQLYPSMRQGRR